jgi:hypothetical protein
MWASVVTASVAVLSLVSTSFPALNQLRQCNGSGSEREKFGPLSSLFLRESHGGIGPDKAFGGLEPWTRMIWVGPGDGLPIWNF